jgi:hypothetical protein
MPTLLQRVRINARQMRDTAEHQRAAAQRAQRRSSEMLDHVQALRDQLVQIEGRLRTEQRLGHS